jgi:hypothetical protein
MTEDEFRELVRAAAHDAGNRHMRKNGRGVWNEEDYNAAVAELDRLWPSELPTLPHQD